MAQKNPISNGNRAGVAPLKRLNLHISQDLHRRIKQHAAAIDSSMTEYVETAVREKLDKP